MAEEHVGPRVYLWCETCAAPTVAIPAGVADVSLCSECGDAFISATLATELLTALANAEAAVEIAVSG